MPLSLVSTLKLNILILGIFLFFVLTSVFLAVWGYGLVGKIAFFLSVITIIPWGTYKNYTGVPEELNIFKKVAISCVAVLVVLVIAIVVGVNFKLMIGGTI